MITEDRLEQLVHTFYAKARGDNAIGPRFNEAIADWPKHLGKLQNLWSSVMLTSGRYKGRPIPAHACHADRIGPADFQRWLTLWEQTANQLFDKRDAAALQNRTCRIAESLRPDLAFYRGQGLKPAHG